MPADVLVDTDVLIDHVRGAARLQRPPGSALHYSVITRCELAAGHESQQPAVANLLAAMAPLAVDEEIADRSDFDRVEGLRLAPA